MEAYGRRPRVCGCVPTSSSQANVQGGLETGASGVLAAGPCSGFNPIDALLEQSPLGKDPGSDAKETRRA